VTSAAPPYTTRLLTPDTWDDFAALVEANNGVWGGCWCIGFHPEGIGKDSTVAGNREAKLAHVNNSTIHQMLVYRDGRCVGWCQYGPPAEVATINNAKAYEKGLAELPDWRIGCLFTGSGSRRKGVARFVSRRSANQQVGPEPWLRADRCYPSLRARRPGRVPVPNRSHGCRGRRPDVPGRSPVLRAGR
jgi:hypothetical protein